MTDHAGALKLIERDLRVMIRELKRIADALEKLTGAGDLITAAGTVTITGQVHAPEVTAEHRQVQTVPDDL